MKAPASRHLANTTDNLALFVVIVTGYVLTAIISPESFALPTGAVLLGAGIAYTLIALFGFAYAESRATSLVIGTYFATQLALGGLILVLSNLGAWLVVLILPAQSAFLSWRWIVSVSVGVIVLFFFSIGGLFNYAAGIQSAISFIPAVVFVVVFGMNTSKAQKAHAEIERLANELTEANAKLREYAIQVEELATTKERNRVAREIHDGLGHYMTAINMQIEAARAVVDTDRHRALDALNKAQSLAKDGLADVRQSVAALRASPLDNRSLRDALARLAEECRTTGIVTELVVNGTPRTLSPQTELTLYRATEEALTNVRKHAHASRADIYLDYSRSVSVLLSIQDNGVGTHNTTGGFGLLGVRERVHLLGGQVRINTNPGHGFCLEVEVPG